MGTARPYLAALLLILGGCAGSNGSSDQSGSGSSGGASGSSSGASGGSSGGSSSGSGGSGGSSGGSGSSSGSSMDGGGGPDAGAPVPDAAAGPGVAGKVTVNRGMTQGQIAPGFVGLSYEKSHLTDSFFTGSNTVLISMLKLLGQSVLRIGGNSVDATTWQPTAQPTMGGTIGQTIGTADVDNLRDFLTATQWTCIYAVGLKKSTPAAAGAEAAYTAKTLGSMLYGFEIGNEIDLYGWSTAQLLGNWGGEANAIRMNVPGAKLTGPATAAHWFIPQFAMSEAKTISLLTQHHYIGDGHSATATMTTMLSPDKNLLTMLQVMSSAVTTNHIADGYRIDETNSFYNHGAPGVSNSLGSALWVIDYMFINAQNGSVGVNFHGGGAGQDGPSSFIYTPIAESNGAVTGAQPIFYGMLLFTMAGTGKVLATTASAGMLNFSAYAVLHGDGTTAVVLANKDSTNTVHATVDVGNNVNSASAIYLQGPAITATTGVTLAGASISPAGQWTAGASTMLAAAGTVVTVDVPPASAALLQVQ